MPRFLRPFATFITVVSALLIAQQSLAQSIAPQIHVTRSANALNWNPQTTPAFKQARAPEALKAPDGRLFVYFVQSSSPQNIMVAISPDQGQTWQPQAIEIKERQTNRPAFGPSVIFFQDAFRLFYHVILDPEKDESFQITQIYSAISSDGTHFAEEKGVRYSKIGQATDPDVVPMKRGLKMWVTTGEMAMSATSLDGYVFQDNARPANSTGVHSDTIAVLGGYRMFYCGEGGIVSQFSKDLLEWESEGLRLKSPPDQIYCDPAVVQLGDGTYRLFFTITAGTPLQEP